MSFATSTRGNEDFFRVTTRVDEINQYEEMTMTSEAKTELKKLRRDLDQLQVAMARLAGRSMVFDAAFGGLLLMAMRKAVSIEDLSASLEVWAGINYPGCRHSSSHLHQGITAALDEIEAFAGDTAPVARKNIFVMN